MILNQSPDETDPKTNRETTQKISKEKEIKAMKTELKKRREASKNKSYEKTK